MPLISTIIPNHNRRDALHRTLVAMRDQTSPASEFEVIVVDDGSTDGSVEMASSLDLSCPFQVLRQENQGPGAARNRGASKAGGDLLVFLDSDMVPDRGLLETYRRGFVESPRAFLIGRQLPLDEAFTSRFDRAFNYVRARDPGPAHLKPEWYYTASGNLAVPSAIFGSLGGFDESLRMTEDTDLAYRAFRQGIQFVYAPDAIGYHNHPKSLEALCSNVRASARWTARLFAKHPEMAALIPAYREVQPIDLRDDPWRLVARKLGRQLMAQPAALAMLRLSTNALERVGAPGAVLRSLYWKVIGGYKFAGFREGLRDSPQKPSADSPALPAKGEV